MTQPPQEENRDRLLLPARAASGRGPATLRKKLGCRRASGTRIAASWASSFQPGATHGRTEAQEAAQERGLRQRGAKSARRSAPAERRRSGQRVQPRPERWIADDAGSVL